MKHFQTVKISCKIRYIQIFFTMRTVNVWNSLSNDIVCCTSINIFVKRLKSFNILHFLKGHACQ